VTLLKTPRGYMKIQDAAKILGLARETLHRWVKEKKIKAEKRGKWRFVLISDIAKFQ